MPSENGVGGGGGGSEAEICKGKYEAKLEWGVGGVWLFFETMHCHLKFVVLSS